ncbi:protocatechuate dioxygenase [Saccharopolyspora erythraea]|uniref:dioxygenase family protein n=1 Tax=Saccharopolyspora erythraea TaxID=1836 RepID=UPI002011CDBF|nr:protocatechuate dioxygenase [Saccharopolyspora erythraea]
MRRWRQYDRHHATGESVSPQATTSSDLTGLFEGANTCTLTPDTTQGPYYFDADKIRSDIREDRQGSRLRLAIKVQDSETCRPLSNAVVEIWHCDAAGLYSGAEAQSTGGGQPAGPRPEGGAPPSGAMPPGPGGGDGGDMADLVPTDDKRYLRGAQVTNADGIVEFTTIWPGWYRGRTVHIHAMVHVSNSRVLTTQVMFEEALNAEVCAAQPYAAHTGRDTFNDNDNIFEETMLLKITEDGDGHLGAIVFSADSDKDGR